MEKKFKLGPLKKRGKKEKASGEKPSIKLARFIIEKQNWIVSVFIAACIFCAVAMLFVEVNYDLTEYLPDTAQSGIGLNKMEDEFGYPVTVCAPWRLWLAQWKRVPATEMLSPQ